MLTVALEERYDDLLSSATLPYLHRSHSPMPFLLIDRFTLSAHRRYNNQFNRCRTGRSKRRSTVGGASSIYCKLEPRQLLATTSITPEIAAEYSADFGSAEFSYQTNIGTLHQAATKFAPISFAQDPFLQLRSRGGHPGLGTINAPWVTYDRFAIVSYEVQESGYYEITDSFLSLRDSRSGGLEFRVFVNDGEALFANVATGKDPFYFDTRIGFVAKGDQIRVAFGSDSDASFDAFDTDFSITRFASREQTVGNYRTDFARSSQGNNTNWRYMWNAPSSSDRSTGGLEDRASYQSLVLTSRGIQVPALTSQRLVGHLRLSQNGGHPGLGYPDATATRDRYAIAAFYIENSGFYAISDSFLELPANSNDGIEIVVGTTANDRLVRSTFTSNPHGDGFDVNLGSLSEGDTIFVAFGARGDHIRDNFRTDFSIVRILPREAPLRSINVSASNTIYAADFGAIANDRIDDHAAITRALAAASAIEGPVNLKFTSGVYNIDQSDLSQGALFVINRQNDLLIDGHGAQFFVSNPAANFLHIFNSKRVILQNFAVDYVQRYANGRTSAEDKYRAITFSQGIIDRVNQDANSITLTIDPAVTVSPSQEFYSKATNPLGSGYVLDREFIGRSKFGSRTRYLPDRGYDIPNSRRHKIFLTSAKGLEVGDRFVFQRRGQQTVIGIFRDSNQVTVSNVIASSSPGTFVSSTRSSHINVLSSHLFIKPGRWKSINADAVHIQDSRENVWVENSTFSGVGDDISNLYSLPSTIVNIVAADVLDLATVNFNHIADGYQDQYKPGDKVLFYDPITGGATREARVISSEAITGGFRANFKTVSRVKFDQPIRGAVVANGNDNDNSVAGFRNDIQVFNRNLSKNGLIQGSYLANSRRYGTFLLAENVQIVDNIFAGLQSSAIAGHNQTSWPIGNVATDILVRNNDFNLIGFGQRYFGDVNTRAVVSFKLDRYRDSLVERPSRLISNLTIADNRFRMWGKAALSVRNAQNVNITGNEFYLSGRDFSLTPLHAIEVAFTTNARVENSKLLETTRTNSDNFISRFNNIDAAFESPSTKF